jgi:hypothetical protein
VALTKELDASRAAARAEGVAWWRLAAQQGHLDAQHLLAAALAAGHGCLQDGKAASEWWRKAIEKGYAPAQHGLAAAYLAQQQGVALRPGVGVRGNLERATELLVLAARQGFAPAQALLFAAQPLTFATAQDFAPRPLPPFRFAGTLLGRRVEVGPAAQDAQWRGCCGTVRAVRQGKYVVELDDGTQLELRTRHLQRHFLAPLDASFVKQPPPPPVEVRYALSPARALGVEAHFASLLVTRVSPEGQAWAAGVRAGCTLVAVGEQPVATLDDAAGALEASRLRGDEQCTVTCLVEQEAKWNVF